jgi:hypothetical protein
MESVWGTSKGVSSAYCIEGRPLGENNTFPEYLSPKPAEFRVGNLTGSRKGYPINTSALNSVLRNWAEAINIVDVIRTEYVNRVSAGDQPLSFVDLFALSEISMSIPAYLLRRSDSPLTSGEIPSQVAGVYRIVAGLGKVAGSLIGRGKIQTPTLSAKQLPDYTENNNLLLTEDGSEACGGPEKLILELLDVTVNGRSQTDTTKTNAFVSLIQDLDAMMEYSIDCVRIKFAMMLYQPAETLTLFGLYDHGVI